MFLNCFYYCIKYWILAKLKKKHTTETIPDPAINKFILLYKSFRKYCGLISMAPNYYETTAGYKQGIIFDYITLFKRF